jgi:hypothetical protein
MSLQTRGFFLPEIDRFRGAVRNLPECKLWFQFAEDLNALGHEILAGHEAPLNDRQRFTITMLFIRVHQSFQAAVVLAERGMIGDARTVLRSAVESAIALWAVAADPTFIDNLIGAHRKTQLTVARMILDDPDYRVSYSAEEIAQMTSTIAALEALKGRRGEAKAINWAAVARVHCKDLYNSLYRIFSGDAVHTTIHALNRHVEAGDDMQITALKVGPDIANMVDTLSGACMTFLWGAEPFARAFEQNDILSRIHKEVQRFSETPRDEPKGI